MSGVSRCGRKCMQVGKACAVGLHFESNTDVIASSVGSRSIKPAVRTNDQFACGIRAIAVGPSEALDKFVCETAIATWTKLENCADVIRTAQQCRSID